MSKSKIVYVGVDDVGPNPWRDGKGSATWENLADSYPIIPEKLARLQESFLSTEVWEGVIARPSQEGYQLAFGHHRFQAYKGLVKDGKMDDGRFPIIERELGDDDMLLFMANENDEEWRHKFLLATMNPISAVVEAFGAGKIELDPVPGEVKGRSSVINDKLYTPLTVARYLGWTNKGTGVKAADRVHIAINALELIAKGALSKEQFLSLNQLQAQTLVKVTQDELKRQAVEFDLEKRAITERIQRAEKEGDTNTKKDLTQKLVGVEKRAITAPVFKAKSLASKLVGEIQKGASTKEALVKVGIEEVTPSPKKVERENPSLLLLRTRYQALTDRAFRDDDPHFREILQKSRPSRATTELIEALEAAGKRALNRAKELKNV